MSEKDLWYAPEFEAPSIFHTLSAPSDIRGLCGKQIDNSNDGVRDRRPPKNVCSTCDKIEGREPDTDVGH